MKKFRKSAVSIVCYIIAAIFTVYLVTVVVSTVVTINQYYAQYGMSPRASEVVNYLMQNALAPLTSIIVTFMAGLIFDEVRKLNPANWASDDEITEAKEAKRIAREAKQIAKGEAAAAAVEKSSELIKPEFADSVEEEAEAAKAAAAAEFAAVVAEDEAADAGKTEDAADAEAASDEEVIGESEEVEAEEGPVHTEFFAEVAEDAEEAADKIAE